MNSSNNQHLADSIMNWSMKISQNQYHMQAEYGSVNRRSNSRSPPNQGESASRLSPPRQFRNHKSSAPAQQVSSLTPANKSTTSWGKLKHSKSSSSNIGCSMEGPELPAQQQQPVPVQETQDDIGHVHSRARPYHKQRHHTTNIVSQQYGQGERAEALNTKSPRDK